MAFFLLAIEGISGTSNSHFLHAVYNILHVNIQYVKNVNWKYQTPPVLHGGFRTPHVSRH